MEIHEIKNVLDNNKEQLSALLSDCQEGPPELMLMASKMGALLEEFSAAEEAVFSQSPIDVTAPDEETQT